MKYKKYCPYKWTSSGEVYDIPAEEFENTIMTYMDISKDTLREKTKYNPKEHTCEFRPRGPGELRNVAERIPKTEVTAYRENEDGTLTLTVQAVFSAEELACAFKSEVTLEIKPDGTAEYLSNHIVSGEECMEPVWYPLFTRAHTVDKE